LLLGVFVYSMANGAAVDRLVKRYDADLAAEQQAKQQIDSGNKPAARQTLVAALKDLDALTLPQVKLVDNKLKHRTHPAGDPASVETLKSQVNSLIDGIDGLVNVAPQDLA